MTPRLVASQDNPFYNGTHASTMGTLWGEEHLDLGATNLARMAIKSLAHGVSTKPGFLGRVVGFDQQIK